MKKLLLLFVISCNLDAVGQTSLGFILDARVNKISPTNGLYDYLNLGATLKKNLTTDLLLVSGTSFRFFESQLNPNDGGDLLTYYRDAHPNEYIGSHGDNLIFSYINVPVGLEFRLNSFLRLQYSLENNFRIGTNKHAKEYLQYGNKSVNVHMLSHSASINIHRYSVGLGLGITFNPSIIRNDLPYTYQYMRDFQKSLAGSYFLTVRLWADLHFKSRKKIL